MDEVKVENKKTLKDRYEDVKEWVGDHFEEIIVGGYALAIGAIVGETIRTLRIYRKQAELEYTKSAIELFKQT